MIVLQGTVQRGIQDWSTKRLSDPEKLKAFAKATGEGQLFPGTLNVNVGRPVQIVEHFRLYGNEINEAEDFLFEVCRINGIWAYRVRPLDYNGNGGAGDHVLEILATKIPNCETGAQVKVELFRNGSLLGPVSPHPQAAVQVAIVPTPDLVVGLFHTLAPAEQAKVRERVR